MTEHKDRCTLLANGQDEEDWCVPSVWSSKQKAEAAKAKAEANSKVSFTVEKWNVDVAEESE